MNPQFPLYIVSKGRWDTRLTSKALELMKVPYHIIVEHQEFEKYAAVIDPAKILVLDPKFQAEYDIFSDIGITTSKGSGPARNFAWEHAIAAGTERHWVMDDNITGFYRLQNNYKLKVEDGTVLRCMEDWVLRYENIAMAGPNYFMFIARKAADKIPPFALNTRIYYCNLIRNDVPFRWRGRYNEDTDLSLRMLKAGWCTVLFNAFLQYKIPTMTVKGGNTDSIYKGGTKAKSQMLVDMHPDVARLTYKFHRIHHEVNYRPFKKNVLKRKKLDIPPGPNEYGMKLKVPLKERPRANRSPT